MSHGLSPEARAILDAAREGDEPTAADRARVGRAMIAAVGGGVVTATASTATASTAAASITASAPVAVGAAASAVGSGAAVAAGSGGLLKVVLTLVVVGAAAATVAVEPWSAPESAPESAPASAPRAVSVVPTPPAPVTPARVSPVGVIPPLPQAVPVSERPPVAVQRTAPRPFRHRARARAAPPPTIAAPVEIPGPAPPAGLAEELRILRAAYAARRAGDAGGALRLLDEHAAQFPRGVLSAERDGSRALLLCERGPSVAAAAAAARFLASHPGSPLAPRIRARCEPVAGDPAPPSHP